MSTREAFELDHAVRTSRFGGWWRRVITSRFGRGWRRVDRRLGKLHAATIWAAVAALATVLAALYAHGQIQAADQQKVAAQQTELLMLVGDIEQEPGQLAAAEAAHVKRSVRLNTETELEAELTSYGQSAQLIVNSLSEGEVSPVEFVQVGKALDQSGDDIEALRDFRNAVHGAGAPPDTIAAAWRNAGSVRYSLADPALGDYDMMIALGHYDMMMAVTAFTRNKHLTESDSEPGDWANNIAQSYLEDASAQIFALPAIPRRCPVAERDLQRAATYLALLKPQSRTDLIKDLTASVGAKYTAVCHAAAPWPDPTGSSA